MGISKIRDDLYISDIHYVQEHDVESKFDHIITCCRNEPARPEDCDMDWSQFGLYDRSAEQQETFDLAVRATIDAIEDDGASVLVHCIAGHSRSPAVLATALASIEGIRFDEARDIIYEQRPGIAVHPSLREHGLDYLDEDPAETWGDMG